MLVVSQTLAAPPATAAPSRQDRATRHRSLTGGTLALTLLSEGLHTVTYQVFDCGCGTLQARLEISQPEVETRRSPTKFMYQSRASILELSFLYALSFIRQPSQRTVRVYIGRGQGIARGRSSADNIRGGRLISCWRDACRSTRISLIGYKPRPAPHNDLSLSDPASLHRAVSHEAHNMFE